MADFPIKIGNKSGIASYSSTLIHGEEQLLITRDGAQYITDGVGGYKLIGGINIEKINISTNGNITLSLNKLYDITSVNVKDSVMTLPTGTETGQSIEILVSVTGFDTNNTFTISGNINGISSNTITIRGSFVDYKFIWSQTSQTWVSPRTVIN